jgi:chemotaxis protein histidine kinase CheA
MVTQQVEPIIIREGGYNWRYLPGNRHLPEKRTQQLEAQLGVSADEFLAAQATAAVRQSPAAQAAAKAAEKKLTAAKAAAAAAAAAAVEGPEQPDSSVASSAEPAAAAQDPQQEVLAAANSAASEAVLSTFVERLKVPVYKALEDLERAGQLQTVRVANATADEVIAAFVHLNVHSGSASRVAIKSGDTDFWQLGMYGEHAPILVNTSRTRNNYLLQQALNWLKCQQGKQYRVRSFAVPSSVVVRQAAVFYSEYVAVCHRM